MSRAHWMSSMFALAVAACASESKNADALTSEVGACLSQRSSPTFLRCDSSRAAAVPWNDAVTIAAGAGTPPAPTGGMIVNGAYQLIAETQYGSVAPDEGVAKAGDLVRRKLFVDNGVANELYESSMPNSRDGGNECWTLTAQPICLINLSGFITTDGLPPIADLRDSTSYSAHGDRLTLIRVLPYIDQATLNILGSATFVDEFVLTANAASATSSIDAGTEPPTPHTRDPRCPTAAPADKDSCSADAAPLECEYDGDAWRRCTTLASCALGLDGVYRFAVDADTACTPANPSACPSTFADATAAAAMQRGDLADITCNYDEGACGCAPGTGENFVRRCAWTCRAETSVINPRTQTACPWPRPLAGDPCSAGDECDYDQPCAATTSLGPALVCRSGHWLVAPRFWAGCGP